MTKNEKIINIFNELYIIHTVLENKYEAQSYKKIKNKNDLKNIPGIGNRTLLKIDEILKTNKLQLLNDLKKNKNIMARFELQQVLGIGPKLSKKLVEENNIKSINQLKKAYQNGKINLNHMQIIGLKYFNKLNSKIPRNEITLFKNKMEKLLKNKFTNIELHMAGSYRRGKQFSNDIDIILTDPKIKTKYHLDNSYIFDDIIHYLMKNKVIIEIINKSKNNMMGITNTHRHIDLKMTPYNLLPFFLLYFGSGESFSREIRQKAKNKGYKLSEWGIFKNSKVIMNKAKDEKQIFNKLKIKYIPPEKR